MIGEWLWYARWVMNVNFNIVCRNTSNNTALLVKLKVSSLAHWWNFPCAPRTSSSQVGIQPSNSYNLTWAIKRTYGQIEYSKFSNEFRQHSLWMKCTESTAICCVRLTFCSTKQCTAMIIELPMSSCLLFLRHRNVCVLFLFLKNRCMFASSSVTSKCESAQTRYERVSALWGLNVIYRCYRINGMRENKTN